jgi:hypothetical protein
LLNQKTVKLALGAPEFRLAFAVCPKISGGLLYFPITATGDPAPESTVETEATLGMLAAPKRAESGYYDAALVVPDDATFGAPLTLTARLSGVPTSTATCDTTVPGEAPTGLAVALDRPAYVATTGKPVQVRISLTYPGKRKPRRVPLRLSAPFGSFSPTRAVSSTEHVATWQLPDEFGGRTQVVVRVLARAPTTLTSSASLSLQPGPLARLEVSSARTRIWSDGESSTELTVKAFDGANNPVSGLSLSASADGTLSAFTPAAAGEYSARYTSPLSRGGSDSVVVRDAAGRIEGRLEILLTDARRMSVAARLGYVTNFAKVSAPLFAAGANVRPPILDGNLVVGLELGLYVSSSTDRDEADVEDVSVTATVLPLLARVVYEIPLGMVMPYFGLASGVSITSTNVSSSSSGEQVSNDAALPLYVPVGATMPLGPGRAGLELGYLYTPVENDSLEGNLGGFEITAAYHYGF